MEIWLPEELGRGQYGLKNIRVRPMVPNIYLDSMPDVILSEVCGISYHLQSNCMKYVDTTMSPMTPMKKVRKMAELSGERGRILSQLWTPEPTLPTNIRQ